MVRYTALREVIGTDTFTSVTGAHLAFTVFSNFALLFLHFNFKKARLQNFHGLFFIFQLGFFILTGYNHSSGLMGNTNRGVGGVYTLAAISGGTVNVDSQIVRININFHILGFRQHGNRRGRRMDTPAGFCTWNTLNAVNPAFIFQTAVSSAPFDREGNFLNPADIWNIGVHNLRFPALAFCIAGEHSKKVTGKKSGFASACACADLDNNVFVIVGVLWQQQDLQFIFKGCFSLCQLVQLSLAHFFKILVNTFVGQHLLAFLYPLKSLLIFVITVDNRFDMGMLLHELLPLCLIGNNIGICYFFIELLIFT